MIGKRARLGTVAYVATGLLLLVSTAIQSPASATEEGFHVEPRLGFTDQLAFQNLTDLLLQLKLAPVEKLGVEITYHRFWLDNAADFRWAGTGAFSRTSLGFVREASNGSTDVGQELDILVSYPVNRWLSVLGGYSKLWGGDVLATSPNSDADFAYLQMQVKY